MEEKIYEVFPPEGLLNFCQLIKDWLDFKNKEEGKSADRVAREDVDVSASMLSRIKRHRADRPLITEFEMSTFWKFANRISTQQFSVPELHWTPRGMYYDAHELLAIALNTESVGYPIEKEGTIKEYAGPNAKAVNLLQSKIGRQSLENFAARTGTTKQRLDFLLAGNDPLLSDIVWIGKVFDKQSDEILQMYGLDPSKGVLQTEPQYKEAIAMITVAMDGASVEDFPEIKNDLYACLAGNRLNKTQIGDIVVELGMDVSSIYDLRVAYGYPIERENTHQQKSKTNKKQNGSKV